MPPGALALEFGAARQEHQQSCGLHVESGAEMTDKAGAFQPGSDWYIVVIYLGETMF